MIRDKRGAWPQIIFILGSLLYVIIKVFSSKWITYFYTTEAFAFLNHLALGQGRETLEFYQGRIQETVFGPGLQILSYLLLAFLIARHFANVSLRKFGLIIFLFLVLTKSEVLFFPPYGDAIGGPFAEGLWLYHNNFNYVGLFHQPNFDVGGPRVYFFSLYPGFLALTLKLIPWTNVFLVFHHLLAFALTAGIVAMLRECGKKSLSNDLSWLAGLVLLSLPLFQSQSEAINMEIPVTFFMMMSAMALCSHRRGQAAIWACVAAATKGIGIIACVVVGVVLCYSAITAPDWKHRLRVFAWMILSCAVGGFIGVAKFLFKDTHVQQGFVHWDAGWPSLQKEFIFYLFLMSLLVFIVWVIRKRQKEDIWVPSIMFLFAGAWFFLFYNFYAVSPRYRVALYPFLVFAVIYSVTRMMKWQRLQQILMVVILIASCWMSYGVFYGSVPDNDHVLLERSLEYRNDLEVNRELVHVAEKHYNNQLIVAPFTIAQALAIPELGYVKSKLNVMIYGFGLKYGGILNYQGLHHIDLTKTVFIGVKVAPIDPQFSYPVGPKDEIIEEIVRGNKKASFFIGGYAIETLWRVRKGIPVH